MTEKNKSVAIGDNGNVKRKRGRPRKYEKPEDKPIWEQIVINPQDMTATNKDNGECIGDREQLFAPSTTPSNKNQFTTSNPDYVVAIERPDLDTTVDKDNNLVLARNALIPQEIREKAILTRDSILNIGGYDPTEKPSKLYEDGNPVLEQLAIYKNGQVLRSRGSHLDTFYTIEDIAKLTEEYFLFIGTHKLNPSVINYALYLGVGVDTLYDWASGRVDVDFREEIIQALNVIHAIKDDLAERSKINPVVHIFNSKNFYGMSDKKETTISVEDKRVDKGHIKNVIDALPD